MNKGDKVMEMIKIICDKSKVWTEKYYNDIHCGDFRDEVIFKESDDIVKIAVTSLRNFLEGLDEFHKEELEKELKKVVENE